MAQQPGKRHYIKGTIVSLLAVLLALALGEVFIRALDLSPETFFLQKGRYKLAENSIIGYELTPYYSGSGSDAEGIFHEISNSLGFRDREHDLRKQDDVYRILMLGDSIVEGLKIQRQEDIFTAVLERELTALGHKIEVLNFGVNGYNTRQEVETLKEKGLQYSPDLVVLAYCINDSYIDSGGVLGELRDEKSRQNKVSKVPSVLTKSALFSLFWAVSKQMNNSDAESTEGPPVRGKPGVASKNLVADSFLVLEQLAEENGFEVLVVVFPFLHELEKGPRFKYLDKVKRLAHKNGFFVHDLSEDLAKCAREDEIADDKLHPNVLGSVCVGKSIASYISTNFNNR